MPQKEEIIAGLKNALERGYSLDLAVQSFVNSGYNRQDVLDSAKMINVSENPPQLQPTKTLQLQPTKFQPIIRQPMQQQIQQQPKSIIQTPPQQKEESKSKLGWIILLAGVLAILLVTLIGFIFFKTQILSLFGK